MSFNNSSVDSYDVYHSAGNEWIGWVIYIVLLVPTLCFNISTIFMVLSSKELRNKINPLLVVYLAFEDTLLSLFCLLSCVSDYDVRSIYLGRTGCELQAMYIVFLMLSTGYTLCCIAYHNERRVRNLPGLTKEGVLRTHILIWIWAALVTAFCTDGPDTSSRVMPSGVYCLVSLPDLLSGLLFFVPGITTIGTFLIHRYIILFLYIKNIWRVGDIHPTIIVDTEDSIKQGAHGEQAFNVDNNTLDISQQHSLGHTPSLYTASDRIDSMYVSDGRASPNIATHHPKPTVHLSEATLHSRLRAARKMFLFVVCYFVCALPVFILSLYEMWGTDAPGEAHIFAGFFIHLNSLLNPLLYFWTNPAALKQVPVLRKYYYRESSTVSTGHEST